MVWVAVLLRHFLVRGGYNGGSVLCLLVNIWLCHCCRFQAWEWKWCDTMMCHAICGFVSKYKVLICDLYYRLFAEEDVISSSNKFNGSTRWWSTTFLPIFIVSEFNCFHMSGINISCVGLMTHHPNIPNILLPSNVKGATVGATIAVADAIDWYWITTVAICCSSAADSALEVCWMIDWVGMGELIPGTWNSNFHLFLLIRLGICRIGGDLTAAPAYFLILLACAVFALSHDIIVRNSVLTLLVSNSILLWTILIVVASGWGLSIRFSIHVSGNWNRVGTVSFPK